MSELANNHEIDDSKGSPRVMGSEDSSGPAVTPSGAAEDELSLLDVLIVLAKYKRAIVGLPLIAAIVATIYSLTLHDIYTATTKLLPPQQSQSASSAIFAQLGGLAALGGLPTPKSTADLYVAMLKSRTVADNMIQRFGLMKTGDIKYPSRAREQLAAITNVSIGKDGIITIEVDDEDPVHAANLANAYVDELLKLTQVLAVTEASQRRLFFEQQFERAKQNLVAAEAAARQALEHGGLVKVDEQGRAMVQTNARLRAEMTLKEVQIGAMRTFAADRNPELLAAEQELESLKRELAKSEGAIGTKLTGGVGAKGMQNVGLLRNLKYYETLYELLARQYEMARIDEAKDSAVVQVLDKAIQPDRKSKPRRSSIVLFSMLGALFAAMLWALSREALAAARMDSKQAGRIQTLKRHIAWR
jgi:tyrosine-protein kinase Etk/Wzc